MLNNVNFEFVTVVGNGSVYQTKSGLGYAFYYDLGGVRQTRKVVTGKTEEELEAKALKFLEKENDNYIMAKEAERIALEEMNKPVVKTFSEVATEWYTEYKSRRHAKKKPLTFTSIDSRNYSIKRLNKHMGDINVSDITNEMAEELIDRCSVKEDGSYYSRSAVDKDRQVFMAVMKYARKHGYCNQIIENMELMDELTVPDKDARFIDESELDKIYKALKDNKRYYTLVKFLVHTGLRQEEAFALTIDDFKVVEDDLIELSINKTIVFEEGNKYNMLPRTKTIGSKREVSVPKEIYEMVMDYYNDCISKESKEEKELRSENGTEGYIFVNKYMGRINKHTFETNFRDYLNRNGITGVTLHMFRHTYASLLLEEKKDIELVAMMLGDDPRTVYNYYYSVCRKSKKDISNRLSQIYNRSNY